MTSPITELLWKDKKKISRFNIPIWFLGNKFITFELTLNVKNADEKEFGQVV